jgi:hypothetical protein
VEKEKRSQRSPEKYIELTKGNIAIEGALEKTTEYLNDR